MNSDLFYKNILLEKYGNSHDALVLTYCDIIRVQQLFKHSYSSHYFRTAVFGFFETIVIINETL